MLLRFINVFRDQGFTWFESPHLMNRGENDDWGPFCIEDFPDLTFDIFDRYGRKVATYRAGEYWDGRYKGTELPTGDYWYVVRPNSPLLNKEYVGHFTLYR